MRLVRSDWTIRSVMFGYLHLRCATIVANVLPGMFRTPRSSALST
jgi:hypothetical protein